MQDETRDTFFKRLEGNFTPEEIERIGNAYRLAKDIHRRQVRDTGERYFEHVRRVALIILDEIEFYDCDTICAALLHDSVEDGWTSSLGMIASSFGNPVAMMVGALNKYEVEVDGMTLSKRKKPDYHERIKGAIAKVRIVKLADRIDNLRTLSGCQPEKQARIRLETVSIYLPMAQRTHSILHRLLVQVLDPSHPASTMVGGA